MNKAQELSYPDISDILANKADGRRQISARTFGEKIEMLEVMRERLTPIKQFRVQKLLKAKR